MWKTNKQLNIAIKQKQEEIEKLKKQTSSKMQLAIENEKIKNENADLRNEIEEVKDTLRLINKLITCNRYDNDAALKRKIIELSSDYQSIR